MDPVEQLIAELEHEASVVDDNTGCTECSHTAAIKRECADRLRKAILERDRKRDAATRCAALEEAASPLRDCSCGACESTEPDKHLVTCVLHIREMILALRTLLLAL